MLKATLNDNKTVTFKTAKLSTYMLQYTDTAKTSPKTSDNILFIAVLLLLSSLALISVVVLKNKNNK